MCTLDNYGVLMEYDPGHRLISNSVPNSRFRITPWYTTDGTTNYVVTSVLPDAGGSAGPGQVTNTADREAPPTN